MTPEELDSLKETYTGRTVMIEALHPELIRWANVPGQVITFNCNGRALVQFEGADQAYLRHRPGISQTGGSARPRIISIFME